jgi:hypothetical protein
LSVSEDETPETLLKRLFWDIKELFKRRASRRIISAVSRLLFISTKENVGFGSSVFYLKVGKSELLSSLS